MNQLFNLLDAIDEVLSAYWSGEVCEECFEKLMEKLTDQFEEFTETEDEESSC